MGSFLHRHGVSQHRNVVSIHLFVYQLVSICAMYAACVKKGHITESIYNLKSCTQFESRPRPVARVISPLSPRVCEVDT